MNEAHLHRVVRGDEQTERGRKQKTGGSEEELAIYVQCSALVYV